MNFTWEAIEGANQALNRLTRAFLEAGTATAPDDAAVVLFKRDVHAALANDLDTPRVIAKLWEIVKNPDVSPAAKRSALLFADKILGLGLSDARPSASLTVRASETVTVSDTVETQVISDFPEDVRRLAVEREEARKEKDFAKSDELRKKIEEAGYDIKDTADGARITKK